MNYSFVIKPKCFAMNYVDINLLLIMKKLFNSLSDETKEDLICEINRIYNFIEESKDEDGSINMSLIDNTRDISEIPIDIELYISKYYYNLYINTKLDFMYC
jgi:hypothetical protein